ncbi:GntT/GntP/DsdX family permease, partial [Campylobacter fetus subsp. venerealis]
MIGTTILNLNISPESTLAPIISFVADPGIVMLISVLVATFTLGLKRNFSMKEIMGHYTVATKDIAMILLIVAGAGALKQ